MTRQNAAISSARIENSIFLIRGQKVLVDTDLADLYEVPVKVLNQAVKRNRSRFPEDFMFQLTAEESDSLRSHIVTLKVGRGRLRKYLPLCLYGAGRCHAFQRASEQEGRAGRY